MKLLLCTECEDMRKLSEWDDEPTTCKCGKSGGRYHEDGLNAEVWGPCVVVGLDNLTLAQAVGAHILEAQSGLPVPCWIFGEPAAHLERGDGG